MEVAKILGNQRLFDPGNTKGVKDFQIRRLSAEKRTNPSKFGSFDLVEKGRGEFTSDRLEAIHSRLNSIAKSVRFVDRTMELTEKYIEQMFDAELQIPGRNHRDVVKMLKPGEQLSQNGDISGGFFMLHKLRHQRKLQQLIDEVS